MSKCRELRGLRVKIWEWKLRKLDMGNVPIFHGLMSDFCRKNNTIVHRNARFVQKRESPNFVWVPISGKVLYNFVSLEASKKSSREWPFQGLPAAHCPNSEPGGTLTTVMIEKRATGKNGSWTKMLSNCDRFTPLKSCTFDVYSAKKKLYMCRSEFRYVCRYVLHIGIQT